MHIATDIKFRDSVSELFVPRAFAANTLWQGTEILLSQWPDVELLPVTKGVPCSGQRRGLPPGLTCTLVTRAPGGQGRSGESVSCQVCTAWTLHDDLHCCDENSDLQCSLQCESPGLQCSLRCAGNPLHWRRAAETPRCQSQHHAGGGGMPGRSEDPEEGGRLWIILFNLVNV